MGEAHRASGQSRRDSGAAIERRSEIPSVMTEGVKLVEAVMRDVEDRGFDETARFAIRLALDEAIANAIRHGNESNPAKMVQVEYKVGSDSFRISICDDGLGFKPDDVPDPTLDENLERPCGRGVMLMRAYMDDIAYNARGNCVTMVKSMPKEAAANNE